MENTLLDKYINGEITDEQFQAERSKLTPEQQKLVSDEVVEEEAKKKIPTALQQLKGLREAGKIVATKNDDKKDFGAQFRNEQFEKAKTTFFTKFGIEKDEDKRSFEEGFKTRDSGKVDVENIIKDMKSYYVSLDPDKFLNLDEEKRQREVEAEELNAQNAGGGGSGSGQGGGQKVSKEVKAYMDASAKQGIILTPEQAIKNLTIAKNGGKIPTF